jgi:enoyl-CoA hydratase/carnithine racemase
VGRKIDAEGGPEQFELVQVEVRGSVGVLVLDRPAKLNALSAQLLLELIGAAGWFNARREVKAVLIRAAGRAFTAGADLSGFAAGVPPGDGESADDPSSGDDRSLAERATLDLGRRMVEAIAGMRALTVAAVHGHCVGGGVLLVAACDVRIASEDAVFSIPEVDLGIPLTWGGVPRLVRELGPALTKELILTCRSFTAAEAQGWRFINRVVARDSLEDEALAVAEKLASQPTYSLTLTKQQVNAVAEEAGSTAQAFREVDHLRAAFRDEESMQTMGRYLTNRTAGRSA